MILTITKWFVAVGALAWLATSVFMIKPDEQGVLQRFGSILNDRVQPGIHCKLPWPCDAVTALKVRQTRRLGVGVALAGQVTGWASAAADVDLLSGDRNIVNIELVVQYDIASPREYLLGSMSPEDLLKSAAKSALTEVVARMPVEAVLYERRVEIQQLVHKRLSELASAYRTGVSINSVNIQRVYPPPEVAAAFNDVVSARADRYRLVEEAQGYANDLRPKAQGEAYRVERLAEAYKQEKIDHARGAAQRVHDMFAKYKDSPADTRHRLYLETLEQCIRKARKVIVDSSSGKNAAGVNLFGGQ